MVNNVNGDILFLYEKASQIYLTTYQSALIEYDVTVSPSALNFGNVDVGDQSSLPITLTSVASVPVSLGAITPTVGYSATDNCGGTLTVGATCTVTVTFSPSAGGANSGSLTMNFGGRQPRGFAQRLRAWRLRAATTTDLSASSNALEPGDDVTLTALVNGTSLTGTVDFTEGGAAIPDCTGVALTGTTATCELTSLTVGAKQYAARYSGDVANRASTSSTVAVDVRQRFTVTANAGSGGSITASRSVISGQTATFTVTPSAGYRVASVSGCGGSLSGTTYTTGAINGACTINATFELANENVDVVAKSKGGGGAMGWPILLIGALGLFARRVFPLLAAGFLVGRAQAEEPRFYTGATFGQAKGEQKSGDVAAGLAARGFSGTDVSIGDLDRDGYRVFAGYRLTQNWVVEVGYADLGEVTSSASASVPAGQAAAYANALAASLPIAPSGYEASVAYRYPFTTSLAASARVGVWKWESEQRAVFGNQRVTLEPDGTDVLFGIGADWSFATHWSLGLEASRYATRDEDVDLLAANVKFLW